jgi:hypothetical protein
VGNEASLLSVGGNVMWLLRFRVVLCFTFYPLCAADGCGESFSIEQTTFDKNILPKALFVQLPKRRLTLAKNVFFSLHAACLHAVSE